MLDRRRALIGGLVAVVVAAVAVVALLWPHNDPKPPTAAPSPSATTASPTPSVGPVRDIGVPDRLVVPSIAVDAPVIQVGTADDQSQEVPSSLTDTGWWRDGQQPGQAGHAVIVGHTASKDEGVFDRLGELAEGDEIEVMSGDERVTFRVTGTQDVPVAEFGKVAPEVYRSEGEPGVVLMTCGDWNGVEFESTVIVTAEAVSAT